MKKTDYRPLYNGIAFYWPDVLFCDVVGEMQVKFPGYNTKTQAKEYLKLMKVVVKHSVSMELAVTKKKAASKINLTKLIVDAFSIARMN